MIRGFTSGLSSFARFRLVEELRQAKWKPSPKTDADMECEFRLRRSRNDHTSLAKINPRPRWRLCRRARGRPRPIGPPLKRRTASGKMNGLPVNKKHGGGDCSFLPAGKIWEKCVLRVGRFKLSTMQ